jgi:hypothetical protein
VACFLGKRGSEMGVGISSSNIFSARVKRRKIFFFFFFKTTTTTTTTNNNAFFIPTRKARRVIINTFKTCNS